MATQQKFTFEGKWQHWGVEAAKLTAHRCDGLPVGVLRVGRQL
jgi:hypothetical protein